MDWVASYAVTVQRFQRALENEIASAALKGRSLRSLAKSSGLAVNTVRGILDRHNIVYRAGRYVKETPDGQ